MKCSLLISLFLFISCGKQSTTYYVDRPINPVAISEAHRVANEENQRRSSLGQSPIIEGLTCSLFQLTPTPTSIQSAILTPTAATFTYSGNFSQSGGDYSGLIPESIRLLYSQWYILRCTGYYIAETSDYQSFSLSSDDGSVLYLDGIKLIDNDGLHGCQQKTSMKYLQRGLHTFRLDYMHGVSGNMCLTLESNTSLINRELFYR